MSLRIKVSITLILLILLLIFNASVSFAIDTNIEIGKTTAVTSSKSATEKLLGSIQVIGSAISVGALVVIGIRYMLSSVEEKSEIKGVLAYYVVGAILIFATVNVLQLFYDVIFLI